MYAIIRAGSKQFRVTEGDIIKVEKLPGNLGDQVTINDVLFVKKENNPIIGKPRVENAKVEAKIVEQNRDKKIIVYRFKKRKGFEKKRGHRQEFSRIKIEKIDI